MNASPNGKPHILVTRRHMPAVEERLARDYDIVGNPDDRPMTTGEVLAGSEGMDAVFVCTTEPLDAAAMAALPDSVKAVLTLSVGTDHLDLEAAKTRGLAGIRVGYAAGPAEIIGWLRAVGTPYPVSTPSLALAHAALDVDDDAWQPALIRIRLERSRLIKRLCAGGARPLPSQANFVLASFADAGAVADGLARRGIAVRRFPDDPALAPCLRITCPGDAARFTRLDDALRRVLGPGDDR